MRTHLVQHPYTPCPRCGQPSSYSGYINDDNYMGYDAVFCSFCDVWLEGGCTDAHCEFCGRRPPRPSEITGPVEWYPKPVPESKGQPDRDDQGSQKKRRMRGA